MKTAIESAAWARSQRAGSDPRALLYGGGIAIGTAIAGGVAYGLLPHPAPLPVLVTAYFALAATLAVAAWLRPQAQDGRITLWDVAGALVFIGVAVSALIAPEHLVAIIEGARE